MSTSDQIHIKEAREKLAAISMFCKKSGVATSMMRNYDTILLDDPFKKQDLLNKVPDDMRPHLLQLIQRYEESLARILASDVVHREETLRAYKSMLAKRIESIGDTSTPKPGQNPEDYGLSLPPYTVKRTAIKITDVISETDYPLPASRELRGDKRVAIPTKKRTSISGSSKALLERIFEHTKAPNSQERKAIAEKCGLTPLQVRVWFTNKRMRSKT